MSAVVTVAVAVVTVADAVVTAVSSPPCRHRRVVTAVMIG